MDWTAHARQVASEVIHPASRWHTPVATTPRHVLVPRWWQFDSDGWTLQDGLTDEAEWLRATYRDRTLVTRVGPLHADHAQPGDHPTGRPTSSSTLPGLTVRLFRHAMIAEDSAVLEVGTGSGYGAALLTNRLSDRQVTSVDVDPYLTEVAAERLASIGLRPTVTAVDATGPLPGEYDRIVATVAVRPIPASWLAALRPGGRLVTTITGMGIILTADRTEDGGAVGRVEWDRAGFMATRSGADYSPGLGGLLDAVRTREGEEVTRGRYPVLEVTEAWEVSSMLSITFPGIEHHYEEDTDGPRTAWMLHPDGSWARATAATASELPVIHQGGPRRLWDELDSIRHQQVVTGQLPVYGATVRVDPDGTCHLRRGRWEATIAEPH